MRSASGLQSPARIGRRRGLRRRHSGKGDVDYRGKNGDALAVRQRARSGNEAVLSFKLDGEEIYCSGALALGKTLSGFELNRALEEGEYEVVAVARVYDEAGELRSSNRTPVMLRVQS